MRAYLDQYICIGLLQSLLTLCILNATLGHYGPLVEFFAAIAGKLCLQHEDLAKKLVAAFARELEVSEDPAIRNNVMIVMCDLCVRYEKVLVHF